MKILFRCDAGPIRGSGHLMRCLSLASALQAAGHECTFASRADGGPLLDLIETKDHTLIRMPHQTGTVRTEEIWDEARQVDDFKLLPHTLYDWVVVDHYALDRHWEQRVRAFTKKILVIDDLANRPHECDFLVDQNEYLDKAERYAGLIPEPARTLLGGRYALLRDEFEQARAKIKPVKERVENVLILMGGADYKGVTLRLIDVLSADLDHMGVGADIIVGPLNPFYSQIQDKARLFPNMHIHNSHSRIPDLMLNADIAFGAGGTSTWELACLGVPTILVPFADNQRAVTEACIANGIARSPGFNDEIDDDNIRDLFISLVKDNVMRQSIKDKACRLIDGLGTERVAGAMSC
jgi:UDP-2,4-diacetamido-2,4,6-trideoxy-beta-L-altropyranose hydrolase